MTGEDKARQLIAQAKREGWQELDLAGIGFRELPPEIGELTELRVLILGKIVKQWVTWSVWKQEILVSNILQGLPPEIRYLKNLKTLALAGTGLSQLPDGIRELTQLQWLDLSFNSLSQLPDWMRELTQLQSLYLSNNGLSQLPDWMGELTQLQSLDLRSNSLSQLPEWMGELTQLQSLYLSNNSLSQLPDWMRELTQLQSLYLSNNGLSQLPDWMGELTQLQWLGLSSNGLSQLPDWMGELTQLQSLDLRSNSLSQLPDWMGELTQLQSLDLSDNSLSQLPEWMGELTQLQSLDLSDNSLSQLPDWMRELTQLQSLDLLNNSLSQLPDWMGELTQLRTLDLRINPLDPPIPPEILEDWHKAQRILDFLREAKRPLNEAKLILVGQGAVGKTSLVERLIDGTFNKDQTKTEGIAIRRWHIDILRNNQPQNVRVNVWDFGGQEIMHATHQFFLTERSLYLLVLNAREDERANQLDRWLKIIQSFGKDSPVLVVINKIDQHPPSLDYRGLQIKYPNIRGFIPISCESGIGINELKNAIHTQIASINNVFNGFPKSWFAVKDKLESDTRNYISYETYQRLCEQHAIPESERQKSLIRLLHDLGIVLNFAEDLRLNDTNVLRPDWVTGGVYRLLNDNSLNTDNKGELSQANRKKVFMPKDSHQLNCYQTDKEQQFILDMMEKFELSFSMEDRKGTYLIPDLFPKQEPDTGSWIDTLNLQLHYNVLPSSVITRFIVKMHHYISKSTYWRTGVVLQIDDNRAYIKADLDDNKIFIRVAGNPNTRRTSLGAIRSTFAAIHKTISALETSERIPLPQDPDELVEYDHLIKLEARGETQYQGKNRNYNIRDLLNGIESPSERGSRDDKHRINQREDGRMTKTQDRVDFGIITIKEEEFNAVIQRFKRTGTRKKRHTYIMSQVQDQNDKQYDIAVIRCLEQGESEAQKIAQDLIEDLNPRWILLVGIAGGLPATEFSLGDVILASRLHDFSLTAALEGKRPELNAGGGPMLPEVASLLQIIPAYASEELNGWNDGLSIAQEKPIPEIPTDLDSEVYYGDSSWKKKVRDTLKRNFPEGSSPRPPIYRVAPGGSSNTLVKDTKLVEQWIESARSITHVEMELAGVYKAAWRADGIRPVLAIRGISDIVGYKRDPDWTEYACHTAAAFTYALIRSGIISQN